MLTILLLSPMQNMAERAPVIAAELGSDLCVEVTCDDASAVASCTSDAT